MKPINANQPSLDEIVFEHRNKEYGAFELRTSYPKTINRAFLIGVGVFLLMLLANFIFARQGDKVLVQYGEEHTFSDPPVDNPPPIEKPKEVEPPKVEEIKTIASLEPKVVENVEEETPPPTQDELIDPVISNVTKEGKISESIAETPPVEASPVANIVELPEDNTAFISVEESPTFMGGVNEMYKFLSKNLKYPAQAQRANIQGKVFLKFIIEKDGSITAVDVMKGIGFGCDEEAARVVKLMPNWKAGRQNGRNVRVMFTIPVFFKLDD